MAKGNTRERLYHVVVINNKTGKKFRMSSEAMTHREACTVLSKMTKYSWRTETVEEAGVSASA